MSLGLLSPGRICPEPHHPPLSPGRLGLVQHQQALNRNCVEPQATCKCRENSCSFICEPAQGRVRSQWLGNLSVASCLPACVTHCSWPATTGTSREGAGTSPALQIFRAPTALTGSEASALGGEARLRARQRRRLRDLDRHAAQADRCPESNQEL